jgi:hypothetical protein
MDKSLELSKALWRTRAFGSLFVAYSLFQASVYTATACIITCETFNTLFWLTAGI